MNLSLIPNLLSSLRIILIPVIIIVGSFNHPYSGYLASSLFLLASATDFFDGYLARKFEATSTLGGLLDLLADKLLITCLLIWLLTIYEPSLILIPVLIIISREIFLSSLREFLSLQDIKKLKVNWLGKLKTFIQMISVILLLAAISQDLYLKEVGIISLWIASFFSVLSMIFYLREVLND